MAELKMKEQKTYIAVVMAIIADAVSLIPSAFLEPGISCSRSRDATSYIYGEWTTT
jgi:hypothetical protein